MIIRDLKYFDPGKIALSGQAFRINIIDEIHTELVAFGRYLQIAQTSFCDSGDGFTYAFTCNETEFEEIWHPYFDLGRDYEAIESSIDNGDSYLKRAAIYSRGIRILRQDPWEMIMSYIISQRRSIPAIKTSVERIARSYGKQIDMTQIISDIKSHENIFVMPMYDEYFAFPSATELKNVTSKDFADAGVGYRADYLWLAVQDVLSGKIDLDSLSTLTDEQLLEVLLSMKGVGIKVANCVSLFGFNRTSAFPIDVWIARIIDRHYAGSFDYKIYGNDAGIIQQFMFYYERTSR